MRRGDPSVAATLDAMLDLDRQRRDLLVRVESLKAERNAASDEVARRKRAKEPADDLMERLKASGEEVKSLDLRLREIEAALDERALSVPNIPHDGTPDGDATANRVLRSWGEPPRRSTFSPRPHWELGVARTLRSPYRGKDCRIGLSLVYRREALGCAGPHEFHARPPHQRARLPGDCTPPYLVNRASPHRHRAASQVCRGGSTASDATTSFSFRRRKCRSPISTVTRFSTSSGCCRWPFVAYALFQPEAGSHGKDTRGLIRVHQFDKVELVRFCRPEESPAEHERITGHAEAVLQRLGLPYRVVELAAGDTGFASARTYDLEVWAAGVGAWLEVSSSSTFTDFQARRANIRYRPAPKAKPEFVHTLNASGVAFPAHDHRAPGEQPSGRRVGAGAGGAGPVSRRRPLDSACVASGFSASRRPRWSCWWPSSPGLSLGTTDAGLPPLPGRRHRHQPALLRGVRRAQRSAARSGGRGAARLGEQVRALGLPLVVTDGAGRVTAAANLPFDRAARRSPGQGVRAAARPAEPADRGPAFAVVHFGPVPATR